jgi:Na+/proline symporter
MLSYFGTDQSQVQRYLSGKSVKESQWGLLFNGFLKVPMQFFILLVGVMVFVFYQFNPAPVNFNPAATKAVKVSEVGSQYKDLEDRYATVFDQKKQVQFALASDPSDTDLRQKVVELNAEQDRIQEQAKELILLADPDQETNDKDYVFIHFILHNLPKGLVGLLLAVILSAAMSSTASELNALASTTTVDLYRKRVVGRSPGHYVRATKWFTFIWGLLAIAVASIANLFDNLIQLVNIIGSIFYGNILGIFLLAFFFKKVRGNAVFAAAVVTQLIIFYIFYIDVLSYLWLNLLGCVLVIVLANLFQRTVLGDTQKAV